MPELGILRHPFRGWTPFSHGTTGPRLVIPIQWLSLCSGKSWNLQKIRWFGPDYNLAVLELSKIGITCPCTLWKEKAHYCLCRLNLKRLPFKHCTPLCLKGYSRYYSIFSHITAPASPMYSGFPKCSLTQTFWITSALPAIQTALVQVKSLSYRSWKNILRIKFSHQNLGGIQFSREVKPFVLMKLTNHQTLVFYIVVWHTRCFPVNWKSCKVTELFWSVVKIQPWATVKFLNHWWTGYNNYCRLVSTFGVRHWK